MDAPVAGASFDSELAGVGSSPLGPDSGPSREDFPSIIAGLDVPAAALGDPPPPSLEDRSLAAGAETVSVG
jgi:hypothetical protein